MDHNRIEYDGAEVPNELVGSLADLADSPGGLPGTLTLGGRPASIRRDGARVVVDVLLPNWSRGR